MLLALEEQSSFLVCVWNVLQDVHPLFWGDMGACGIEPEVDCLFRTEDIGVISEGDRVVSGGIGVISEGVIDISGTAAYNSDARPETF